MERLVDGNGRIRWGIYAEPVEEVNYLDYDLRTPMGLRIPRPLRRLIANQFHFLGVIDPSVIVAAAVVDLKYLESAFLYVFDRRTHELVEVSDIAPGCARRATISPTPESPSSRYASGRLSIGLSRDRFEAASKAIQVELSLEASHAAPLRICTRAGYTRWVYTQKTSPLRVKGTLRLGGRTTELSSPSSLALQDWTCGYMRRETCWNWASTAWTLPDGRSYGMNLSCGVNETSFTENAFWIDGAMTKVDTVDFVYDPDDVMAPWEISSSDGRVRLSFLPEGKRGEKVNAFFVASRFTQLVGTFSGTVTSAQGETIDITGCPGFAEDHFARW